MTLENLSQRNKDLIVTITEGLGFKGSLPMESEYEAVLNDGNVLSSLDDYTDEEIYEGLEFFPTIYPFLDFVFHAINRIDSSDHQEFEFRKTIDDGFENSAPLIELIRATCSSDKTVKLSKDDPEAFQEVVYEMLKNLIRAKKEGNLQPKNGAELKVVISFLKSHPESTTVFFEKLIKEDPFLIPELIGLLKALIEVAENDTFGNEETNAYMISLLNVVLSISTFKTESGDYDFVNTGYNNFENLITSFPKAFLLFFKEIAGMFDDDSLKIEKADIQEVQKMIALTKKIVEDNDLFDSTKRKFFSVFMSTLIREYLLSFSKEQGLNFIETLKKVMNLDLNHELTENDKKILRHKSHAMENIFMDIFSSDDVSEYVPDNIEEVLDEEYGSQSPTGDPKETKANFMEEIIKTSMGPNSTGSSEKEDFFKNFKGLL